MIGRSCNGCRCVGRDGIEQALGNKVGHGGNSVSLVSRLLVIDITSARQSTEITLSFPEVGKHICPGAIG